VTTPAQLDTAARAGIAKPAATSGRVYAHARGRPNATICTVSPAVSTDTLTPRNGGSACGYQPGFT
jgi:hypothetical protein